MFQLHLPAAPAPTILARTTLILRNHRPTNRSSDGGIVVVSEERALSLFAIWSIFALN